MESPAASLKEHFQRLRGLSREMRDRAVQGAWEELPALTAQRTEVLGLAFAAPIPAELAAECAAAITELQQLDAELLMAAETRREALAREILGVQQGRRGTRSYTEVGEA